MADQIVINVGLQGDVTRVGLVMIDENGLHHLTTIKTKVLDRNSPRTLEVYVNDVKVYESSPTGKKWKDG